jgi:hypothetical protein
MNIIVIFLLFVGLFLIMQGIYEEKINNLEKNKTIEYKFIPRTYYEEQLADSTLSSQVDSMFNYDSPWSNRVSVKNAVSV